MEPIIVVENKTLTLNASPLIEIPKFDKTSSSVRHGNHFDYFGIFKCEDEHL